MSSCSFQFSKCKQMAFWFGEQLLFPKLLLHLCAGCSFTFSCSFQGCCAVKGSKGERQRGKNFIQILSYKHRWVSSIWSIKKPQELFVSFPFLSLWKVIFAWWESTEPADVKGSILRGTASESGPGCSNSCCRCLWLQNVREEVARAFSNAEWGGWMYVFF